jgi:hypothetical protein
VGLGSDVPDANQSIVHVVFLDFAVDAVQENADPSVHGYEIVLDGHGESGRGAGADENTGAIDVMDATVLDDDGPVRAAPIFRPDPNTTALIGLTTRPDLVDGAGRAGGVENSRQPDVRRTTRLVTPRTIHADIGDFTGLAFWTSIWAATDSVKMLVTFAARGTLGTVITTWSWLPASMPCKVNGREIVICSG